MLLLSVSIFVPTSKDIFGISYNIYGSESLRNKLYVKIHRPNFDRVLV